MLPLIAGERLDQETFHARYEAMPPDTRAELIGGVVHLGGRTTARHGELTGDVIYWLAEYSYATAGTEALGRTTVILGPESEPEPDGCLLIAIAGLGQTHEVDEYVAGAPELIAEIADVSEGIDLHVKKLDYERAGVQEYVVVALRQQRIFWFRLRQGKYEELSPDATGVFRSEVFPGLWLDSSALLQLDHPRLHAAMAAGLASPEHAAFVAKLAAAKK